MNLKISGFNNEGGFNGLYLVIHHNHSAAEEVVMSNDAREPLGG